MFDSKPCASFLCALLTHRAGSYRASALEIWRAAVYSREPTESYLVDPASSHTLVLKIKPCMSKCSVLLHTRLRTAHYNSYSLFDGFFSVDNRGNSRANTCQYRCRLRVASIY